MEKHHSSKYQNYNLEIMKMADLRKGVTNWITSMATWSVCPPVDGFM